MGEETQRARWKRRKRVEDRSDLASLPRWPKKLDYCTLDSISSVGHLSRGNGDKSDQPFLSIDSRPTIGKSPLCDHLLCDRSGSAFTIETRHGMTRVGRIFRVELEKRLDNRRIGSRRQRGTFAPTIRLYPVASPHG